MANIYIKADTSDVERMMQRADLAVGPESIMYWMRTKMTDHLRFTAGVRFANEGDSASGKWAALKESTTRIRAYEGFGPAHPINVRTGQLRSHILQSEPAIFGGAGAVGMSWPGQASGITALKFINAQKGGTTHTPEGGSASFPARPVVALSDRDIVFAGVSLGRHIAERIATGGF